MAFHSEIKVNYQVLEDIAADLKRYDTALQTMQRSIASMDRIIAENEGKTFTALSKIKHDFDDDIVKCKEEVTDIYTSISNYVSDMKSIIFAVPNGALMTVDKLDILANKATIDSACHSIWVTYHNNPGSYINTDNYEAGSDALNKILSDIDRVAKMRAAIAASATKIEGYYKEIDKIYKKKVVKFEDKDDTHASKIRRIHSKHTSREETQREVDEFNFKMLEGILDGLKDFGIGIVKFLKLSGSVLVYIFCKIIRAEPPECCKRELDSLKGLKGLTPWDLVESVCQNASDTVAEKGYAYSAGYVAADIAAAKASAALAKKLIKLVKGRRAIRVGDTLEDGSEVVRISSAEEANRELARGKYVKPPYDPNKSVYIVKTSGKEKFVRVYGGKSGQKGQWIMKYDDVKGLTPKQIQEKYALPAEPTKICDVKVPKGTELRTGTAAPVEGWGKGGGQQYDLQGQRLLNDAWVNERNIGGIVE